MFPGTRAFDTSQIDPALRRISAALVMRIDAAGLAEVMPRGPCAPRVKPEVVGTVHNLEAGRDGCHRRGLPARAERTGAARGVTQSIRQHRRQPNSPAMTTGADLGGIAHLRLTLGRRLSITSYLAAGCGG